ncbi:Argininosuccinate lyase [Buchnera aphidicola (Thelaxes suberi)]|uniref:argininosuccinate lyase n=1 Tax=Buchnera aphidicola TaxID=9 RepID=UPI0034646D8A
MNLWGGRFSNSTENNFKKFNQSIKFDYILVKEDIKASIAWSKSLVQGKVLTNQEQIQIEKQLNILLKNVTEQPNDPKKMDVEDIHTWVEKKLVENLGELGKKLHTGRSRNDQVTTDLKLWCRIQIKNLIKNICNFQNQLVEKAETTIDVIMPGYTHLQRAQPIRFAHWCLAYYEMLERDKSRLKDSLHRLNTCPLGSGALSGTSWNIDRKALADNMNFNAPTNNSLDSVSDRDYVIDILSTASIGMMHLSRFSEDLIFFSSNESNYINFPDDITSGSSLMPQKKNPDILELIRGKCGRVYGALIGILVTLKGLPLAYNKDLQEDKEGLIDAINTWNNSLNMASLVIKKIQLNKTICYQSAQESYSNATDLADYLVTKGIAFRNAHYIVGKIVLKAIDMKVTLEKMNLNILKQFCNVIENDVFQYIAIEKIIQNHNTYGGVSKEQVLIALRNAKKKNNTKYIL